MIFNVLSISSQSLLRKDRVNFQISWQIFCLYLFNADFNLLKGKSLSQIFLLFRGSYKFNGFIGFSSHKPALRVIKTVGKSVIFALQKLIFNERYFDFLLNRILFNNCSSVTFRLMNKFQSSFNWIYFIWGELTKFLSSWHQFSNVNLLYS